MKSYLLKRATPFLAKSVVDPPAARNRLARAVVDPRDRGGCVAAADMPAQAAARLIEHGDPVQHAEPLPQHQHRGVKRPENQRHQRVPREHRELMLEGKRRLRRAAVVPGAADRLRRLRQAADLLVRRVLNDLRHGELIQRVAHLEDGADLLVAQAAAVIRHDGLQRIQRPRAAIVRHERPHARTHLQKAAVLQLRDAAVDDGAAHAHRLRQLPPERQL